MEISRGQMLRDMRKKDHRGRFVPFDVRLVTANRAADTGGEWLELKQVTLPKMEVKRLEGVQGSESRQEIPDAPTSLGMTGTGDGKKEPNHKLRGTINFKLPNGEIRKGHVRLIRKYNGMTVI